MIFVYVLIAVIISEVSGYQNDVNIGSRPPTILAVLGVSAMCGLNGITVSIEFDSPFTGKIYSLNYANVHECIYYNAQEMKNVLFTIPLHRCGTRVTRNTREIIDTVENRVYVQMEKFTQTALDRQYSFLCELVHSKALLGINGNSPVITNDIRRHPGRSQIGQNLPVLPPMPAQNPILPVSNFPISRPNFPAYPTAPVSFQPQNLPVAPPPPYNSPASPQTIVPSNVNYQNERFPNQPNSIVPVHSPFIDSPTTEKKTQFTPLQSSSSTTYYNTQPNVPIVPQNTQIQNTNHPVSHPGSNVNESSSFLQKIPVYSSTEPVRIYATQQINKTESLGNVYLEIQDGDGPKANTVSKPVKIGDKITLVIRSEDVPKDEKQYNMFVHSCVASDGPGTTKIDLIDKSGCAASSQVIDNMRRERTNKTIVYYFKLRAFKFPGPDDVYFSCLVDVSSMYNFPELCKNPESPKRYLSKRELITANIDSIPLFNDIKVKLDQDEPPTRPMSLENSPVENHFCLALFGTVFLFILMFFLTLSFIGLSITSLWLFLRLKKLQAFK